MIDVKLKWASIGNDDETKMDFIFNNFDFLVNYMFVKLGSVLETAIQQTQLNEIKTYIGDCNGRYTIDGDGNLKTNKKVFKGTILECLFDLFLIDLFIFKPIRIDMPHNCQLVEYCSTDDSNRYFNITIECEDTSYHIISHELDVIFVQDSDVKTRNCHISGTYITEIISIASTLNSTDSKDHEIIKNFIVHNIDEHLTYGLISELFNAMKICC